MSARQLHRRLGPGGCLQVAGLTPHGRPRSAVAGARARAVRSSAPAVPRMRASARPSERRLLGTSCRSPAPHDLRVSLVDRRKGSSAACAIEFHAASTPGSGSRVGWWAAACRAEPEPRTARPVSPRRGSAARRRRVPRPNPDNGSSRSRREAQRRSLRSPPRPASDRRSGSPPGPRSSRQAPP
jgi:hypothetical protein